MFEGPEAELTLTANAQPALMAVSLAASACSKPKPGWTSRATRPSSPAIRWANIPRFARPAR